MTTTFRDAADSTLHALSGFAHEARDRFDDLPTPHLSVPHMTMPHMTMPQLAIPHRHQPSHRRRRGAVLVLAVLAVITGAVWMRRRGAVEDHPAEYWPHDDHIAGPDAAADGDLPQPDVTPLLSA